MSRWVFSPFPLSLEWTEWAPWSSCSQSCGGGSRTRDRNCTSHDGAITSLATASSLLGGDSGNLQALQTTCPGEREELESCGEDSCPGKSLVGSILHFCFFLCPVSGTSSNGCKCGMTSSRQPSEDSVSEVKILLKMREADISFQKVTLEQAWIGKLQLSNGDFYVQDCSATLVSFFQTQA